MTLTTKSTHCGNIQEKLKNSFSSNQETGGTPAVFTAGIHRKKGEVYD